jgi:phenylacetate-CoA ligase
VFFAFSFGPFLGFWMAFEAAARMGCLCIPGGGLRSAARLRMMLDNEATVLCCTPTYAIRLGEVAREEGIDLSESKVRVIIAAGEPGASVPAVREAIEKAWPGARLFDHHGMTEVGPVTYEDARRPMSLCVIERAYLAEVIDPRTQRAVERGQVGELVLTTLGRHGSPLLRYRTNDMVKLGYAELDGESRMVFEGGILGRADDMVFVRGVNVYPSAVDQIVRAFGEVAEYRVTVRNERAMAELSVEVEPAASCGDAAGLCAKIAEAMRDALALRVPVTAVGAGALPRFEMKAKRWVRIGDRG